MFTEWNLTPQLKILHVISNLFLLSLDLSYQFSCSVVSDSLQPHGLQHVRLPCPSPNPGACWNSCPSSRWCHPTIYSYIIPSPPAFNLSQHQGLFQQVSSSNQVTKVLEFQLQHQSSQWILRTDFLEDWLVWSPCSRRESSPAPQFASISSSALSFLYGPTLTSVNDSPSPLAWRPDFPGAPREAHWPRRRTSRETAHWTMFNLT